ncbi:MAG TPA: hypothetical protein VJ793_15640 [Anaerolineae bacterium]|nr:hypothetical protein [Anaerolineae bacterium]
MRAAYQIVQYATFQLPPLCPDSPEWYAHMVAVAPYARGVNALKTLFSAAL